ncbi:TetR/AcrR family transcriptional regulator [Nocardioides sp. NPDC057764]|uniref:TetR/AcrR family transcriptional regulator n=1 Tax=Nocardioides sp. NPDC057764 TaxID=3346243 RepID=UPI00366CF074
MPQVSHLAPRDQILEASATLFVDEGFAGTSTRDIAELVGIRQASLYYHFAGKDGILAELLQQSVRPSLDKVERIEAECPAEVPEAALYLLALIDVHTLARAPQNIGKLYRMPDVMKLEIYQQFRASLKALTKAYGRLGARIASEPVAATTSTNQLGGILIQLTETVIKSRADNHKIRPAETHALATSCLRACGVPQDRIEVAAATATDLMPRFIEEQHAQ